MTASIPRTASRALTNAALPYLLELAGKGLDRALADNPGLAARASRFGNSVCSTIASTREELLRAAKERKLLA